MAHVLLAGLAKFGDVEVAHLVSLFHYTQVSLLADNLTIAVATSVGRVLLHHIIGLDAAMGVRVVLRRVKHGMGVGDERLLGGLLVAGLVAVARAVRIDSGWLAHD